MKVLTICTEHPDIVFGGMGNHCRYLFETMAEKKLAKVTYLTQHAKTAFTQPHKYELRSSEGLYFGQRTTDTEILLENTIRMTVAAGEILGQAERDGSPFDIVHLHDYPGTQIGIDLKRMFDIPVVHTWHLFQHQVAAVEKHLNADIVAQSQMLEIAGLVKSDTNIFCSKSMQTYAKEKIGVSIQNSHVILNGVPFAEFELLQSEHVKKSFAPLRSEFPDKPLVLFSGRLAEQKGYTEILDAIEMTDEFCFVIMGHFIHGDEEFLGHHPNLKRTYELLKKYPDRIRCTGFKSGQDRLPYYSICDVGLMPSKAEPFGISMLEFMAAGIPTVSTCVDGMGEFANESNCIRLSPMAINGESIVQSLRLALDAPKVLKVKAQMDAKTYDWESVARRTVYAYKGLIG